MDERLSLHTIENPAVGARSYLVGDLEAVAAVDPPRAVEPIVELATRLGVRIMHVVDTHVHEDHLSGGAALARALGVPYLVPGGAPVKVAGVEVVGIDDGEWIEVGTMALVALATPGHASHHLAFAVHDGTGPEAVLTGGALSFGTVGRVDLEEGDLHLAEAARAQLRSARRLAAVLPGSAAVLPGHVPPSFVLVDSGAAVAASTLDEEKRRNPVFTA
ncbi:MAG TPA: MBL fold metallo-hydrolase, partial [Acidimicrobiia bacterium]|nr:MBL fold metallo-hydrolase [Acidimicrobiia bacterium]